MSTKREPGCSHPNVASHKDYAMCLDCGAVDPRPLTEREGVIGDLSPAIDQLLDQHEDCDCASCRPWTY